MYLLSLHSLCVCLCAFLLTNVDIMSNFCAYIMSSNCTHFTNMSLLEANPSERKRKLTFILLDTNNSGVILTFVWWVQRFFLFLEFIPFFSTHLEKILIYHSRQMDVLISKSVDRVIESVKHRYSQWKVWFPPPALGPSVLTSPVKKKHNVLYVEKCCFLCTTCVLRVKWEQSLCFSLLLRCPWTRH